MHPEASHRLLFTFHASSVAWAAHHLASFGSAPKLGYFVRPEASHRLLFTLHASSGAWAAHHLASFGSAGKPWLEGKLL